MGQGFLSTYHAEQHAKACLNNGGAMPGTIFISQFQSAPNAAFSQGTEVTSGGQSRVAVPATSEYWDYSNGLLTNKAAIRMNVATADYPTIVAVCGHYAATAGEAIFGYILTNPKTIPSGDYFEIPAGEIQINFAAVN